MHVALFLQQETILKREMVELVRSQHDILTFVMCWLQMQSLQPNYF